MLRCFPPLALALAGLAVPGCAWIHPTEPQRPLQGALSEPRFEEVAVDFAHRWDHATSHHLTGAAVLDLDGDGFPAFAVKGDRRDDQPYAGGWRLWRNDGGFRFADATHEAGLDGLGFAWGAVFEDMNLDGRLDLLASQNYVKWPVHRLFKFPGKLLLGAVDGLDFRASEAAPNPAYENSPVIADLDGDARPDLFWLNNDGPSRAYLNRTPGHAVAVALPDTVAALGARVRLEGAGAGYTREVASSSGLGSDHGSTLVFGLGAATQAGGLVVTWADGRTTELASPPLDRRVHLEPPPSLAAR